MWLNRKRLMMLPTRPVTHLIIGQTRFALAPLETFFDAVPSSCSRGPTPTARCSGGTALEDNNHFHDCILIAVTVAHHCHQFLCLVGAAVLSDYTPFDYLDHQGTFEPSRTSIRRQAAFVERLAPDFLRFGQGRWERRPRPGDAGSGVSRSHRRVRGDSRADSARPRQPSDDETSTDALSHRHRQSTGGGGSEAPCAASISKAN